VKIGFIGAGKVANAFGLYLTSKKLSVEYVYSKTKASALKMAKLTHSSYCETTKELVEKSDLVFITTGDSQISNVAELIASEFRMETDRKKFVLKEKTFIHMSGALTSDELLLLGELGANCYSLHPLQSFAESGKALSELATSVFSIEGDTQNDNVKILLRAMGNEIIKLSKENKVKYHIAACLSSNYLITLLNSSIEIFDEIGIERETAIKALMPLIKGAVSNFERFNLEDALTGPIKRGDYKTIEHHINDLENSKFIELYEVMGRYTIPIAKKSGTDKSKLEQIEKLLR
jgi:predicted short-subunit dehydrogenase-like oxidoreductase (DUF2520 family)